MIKKEEKRIDFRDRPLVFLDLETTGLDPREHEIIEVACLVVSGKTRRVLKKYKSRVKPEHIDTADPEALKINGYSEKKWRNARPANKILNEVARIAPGGIIFGWNISFDWTFLEAAFKRFGISHKFDYARIDVMSIAYSKLYPVKEVQKLGLRKVAPFLEIKDLPEVHDAMGDVLATYKVFTKLMGWNED